MTHLSRHIIVKGRVQGVGYRAFVEREALMRGIEGFVRNRRDGTVEALLVGDSATVEDMLSALRRGPPGSHVEAIDATDAGADALGQRRTGERFSLLRTV